MKKLRLKNNNIGMTLVELLVAIAIFAAAIVPMLYAFVYSTGFNFKAQQTMQSTGIAQAIIEKCKAANTDYDQLVLDLTSGDILASNNNFSIDSISVSGNVFTLNNVKPLTFDGNAVADAVDGGNANRRSYDVKVTLSPIGDAITDYSSFHSMRSGVTANYLTVDTLRSQDEIFQAGFEELLKQTIRDNVVVSPALAPGASLDPYADILIDDLDIKKLQIERLITIVADDNGVKMTVEYFYVDYDGATALNLNHTVNVGGVDRTARCTATPASSLDPASYPVYEADILDGSPASSIFFYYYPLYKASVGGDGTIDTSDDTAGFIDHFILKNSMTADYLGNHDDTSRLDFYLFKQLPLSGTDTFYADGDIETLDRDYKPIIDLSGSASFPTNLYHNLLWNVVTGSETDVTAPEVNEDHIHEFICRTVVCHRDPSNPALLDLSYQASQNYKDTFYVISVPGYEHDSFILEDKAVIPYGSEKVSGVTTGRFGSRFIITVEVYPHGTSLAEDTQIETMTSEFLNW